MTLPYSGVTQFANTTIHSASTHNTPHNELLANDNYLESQITAISLVAGAIIAFAQSSAPSGWLLCDGSAISRVTYVTLFTAIGTTYGVGNGSTTFNLPDLRGVFLRGLDLGRGLDAGRVLGSYQADATQRVQGAHGTDDRTTYAVTGAFYASGYAGSTGSEGAEGGPWMAFDNARVARTANEDRPKNVAIIYCIKY